MTNKDANKLLDSTTEITASKDAKVAKKAPNKKVISVKENKVSVEEKDENKLDSQTLDMLKRVRDQKLVSGGKDPFFVPEKDKDKKFEYRWASTDKDTPESIESLKEIGWREVDNYKTITTGGYTVNGQPGKHILMRLNKIVHEELQKIQNEVNERKKNAVFAPELLYKDGGKNKMGLSAKEDLSAKDDFLKSL